MKSLADFFAGDDADGMRKLGVHAALNFRGVQIRMGFEMRDLPERMNSGIGAAGPVNRDSLLGDLLQRVLDGALNRGNFRLELPAVKLRAVVGDDEFNVLHCAEGLSHGGLGKSGGRTLRFS